MHGHRNRARRGSAPHRHSDSNSRLWVGPNRTVEKQGASALLLLSCFSPSSCSNSRTDDPEAGPLDSRLNIGWDKPSRRIQDFVKAITSQDQQRKNAFNLNAEPSDCWWEKGFPVTSHNSSEPAEISRATCWNRTKNRATRGIRNKGSDTPVETREHHVERIRKLTCLFNVKQVFQTKSLLLNCELICTQ